MPCYQVIAISVVFKVENIDILKEALEKLGARFYTTAQGFSVQMEDGARFEINTRNSTVSSTWTNDKKELTDYSNTVKRAYSETVLEKAAKKNRWFLNKRGENQYAMVKH